MGTTTRKLRGRKLPRTEISRSALASSFVFLLWHNVAHGPGLARAPQAALLPSFRASVTRLTRSQVVIHSLLLLRAVSHASKVTAPTTRQTQCTFKFVAHRRPSSPITSFLSTHNDTSNSTPVRQSVHRALSAFVVTLSSSLPRQVAVVIARSSKHQNLSFFSAQAHFEG